MPQVQAGVVGAAELYSQPAADTRWSMNLAQPGVWSYIWVGIALTYLIGIYIGAIRISGRTAA